MPRPWENLPPWFKQVLRTYLYGMVVALLAIGALFVVNVFIPLGTQNLVRASGTVFLLLVGWLWGVVSAWMLRYKPLIPAGVLGMATGAATVVFGTLDIWDLVGTYSLARIPWSLFWLQFVAAAAVAVVRAYVRGEHLRLAIPALFGIAVGGSLAAASILLDVQTSAADKLGSSGSGLAIPLCVAGCLFLIPDRPRLKVARNVGFAGFVELSLFLAAKPWIDNSRMVERLDIAMWAVAVILGLVALTFFLIDLAGLRSPPATDQA